MKCTINIDHIIGSFLHNCLKKYIFTMLKYIFILKFDKNTYCCSEFDC